MCVAEGLRDMVRLMLNVKPELRPDEHEFMKVTNFSLILIVTVYKLNQTNLFYTNKTFNMLFTSLRKVWCNHNLICEYFVITRSHMQMVWWRLPIIPLNSPMIWLLTYDYPILFKFVFIFGKALSSSYSITLFRDLEVFWLHLMYVSDIRSKRI